MEGRSVLQWDKDDCAAAGPREVRPARPRHAHDAAHRGRPRARVRRRRHRPRDDPAGGRGLRPVVRGRHRRRVPGREPRADGDAAAAAAALLLRPRGGSRVDPARSDPGRLGAPVPPAPQRRGGGHLHPPAHRAVPEEDARRAAVPGAAHAARGRLRGVQRGRSRPAAPGDGIEAFAGAHGAHARAVDGRAWPSAASPATPPRRSTRSWRRSRASGSPRATR